MDKFSTLFEQSYYRLDSILNEEGEPEIDPTLPEQEGGQTQSAIPPVDPETSSELPILNNDEIAEFIIAIKQFYSKEHAELTQDQIDQIKAINPRDSREDADIQASIGVLKNIFNVGGVTTAPTTIPDSDYE